MRAVGFVDNDGETILFGQLHTLYIVGGDTLIGGIDQNQIAAVGILLYVILQYLCTNAKGQIGVCIQF